MKLCLCTLSSVTVNGWAAPPLVDYSACVCVDIHTPICMKRGTKKKKKKCWHVLESGKSSTGIKHAWKHWKLYWFMSSQFNWNSSTVVKKKKAKSHLGNRIAWQSAGSSIISLFTLSNTFRVTAAHEFRWQRDRERQKNPPRRYFPSLTLSFYLSFLYGDSLSTQVAAGLLINPHFLPLICATTPDADENFTRSRERMCVSHLAQTCSSIDVTTKNKNDACCALCPGYLEETFSSYSSKLPVYTFSST